MFANLFLGRLTIFLATSNEPVALSLGSTCDKKEGDKERDKGRRKIGHSIKAKPIYHAYCTTSVEMLVTCDEPLVDSMLSVATLYVNSLPITCTRTCTSLTLILLKLNTHTHTHQFEFNIK